MDPQHRVLKNCKSVKKTIQINLNDYVHTPKWFPGRHTEKQMDKYLLNIFRDKLSLPLWACISKKRVYLTNKVYSSTVKFTHGKTSSSVVIEHDFLRKYSSSSGLFLSYLSKREHNTESLLIVKAALLVAAQGRNTQLGKLIRTCVRHMVKEIYNCLGPIYFCCEYWMTHESFWQLHDKVAPKIDAFISKYHKYCRLGGRAGGNYKPPPFTKQSNNNKCLVGTCITLLHGGSTNWPNV